MYLKCLKSVIPIFFWNDGRKNKKWKCTCFWFFYVMELWRSHFLSCSMIPHAADCSVIYGKCGPVFNAKFGSFHQTSVLLRWSVEGIFTSRVLTLWKGLTLEAMCFIKQVGLWTNIRSKAAPNMALRCLAFICQRTVKRETVGSISVIDSFSSGRPSESSLLPRPLP